MKLKYLFLLLFSVACTLVQAQPRTEIVLCDSIGNALTRTIDVPIEPQNDSLRIGLYGHGEIDLDSLDVKFGFIHQTKYKRNTVQIDYFTTSNTTYSKTLAIDLNSSTESFTGRVVGIPKTAMYGYNVLRITITAAASGNVPTGSKQKVAVIITKFNS